jgi:Rap guanine nucleotide exchange factor 1
VHDLNYHVRQVKHALTHFKDVIFKNKLEMLAGNGTVVLESIGIVLATVQSYQLNEHSTVIISAIQQVHLALGNLLKLCDEVTISPESEECACLNNDNVKEVVDLVDSAIQNLVALVNEKLTERANHPAVVNKSSNTLQRPTIDVAGQRTSLPDIPLTPRERDILEQTSLKAVRASHSTESILRDSSPPPKPPLPNRTSEPPPLPPKRKTINGKGNQDNEISNESLSFLGCSSDRTSLRSRSPEDNSSLLSASAGSLDSALNHSREEDELKTICCNHADDQKDSSVNSGEHH